MAKKYVSSFDVMNNKIFVKDSESRGLITSMEQRLDSVEARSAKKHTTVQSMKNDMDLKVGDMVLTGGYFQQNDGGGGSYIIKTDASTNKNELLDNNLFAELQYINSMCPESFGYVNDLGVVVNEMLTSGVKSIKLYAKSYVSSATITIGSDGVVFDMNGCIVEKTGAGYLFVIENCTKVRICNGYVSSLVTGFSCFKINNVNNITVDRVQSMNGKFVDFFTMTSVKESNFINNNIIMDTANMAGKIFNMEGCVNNMFNNNFLGYTEYCFYHGAIITDGHYCEGSIITNNVLVFCMNTIHCLWGTFIDVSHNIIDFCGAALYHQNGYGCVLDSNYIGTHYNDKFLFTINVSDTKITNNVVMNNNNTNIGFSSSKECVFSGNSLTNINTTCILCTKNSILEDNTFHNFTSNAINTLAFYDFFAISGNVKTYTVADNYILSYSLSDGVNFGVGEIAQNNGVLTFINSAGTITFNMNNAGAFSVAGGTGVVKGRISIKAFI